MKAILRAADGFGADLNVTNTSELQKRQSHGTMPVRYTYQVKCVQTEAAYTYVSSRQSAILRPLWHRVSEFCLFCVYYFTMRAAMCLLLLCHCALSLHEKSKAMQRCTGKILARNKESGSEHQYTGYQKALSHRCARHVLHHHVLLWYSPTACC